MSGRVVACSNPGSVCSIVPLSTSSFLDRLPRREADERIIGDVIGDDRAGGRPNVVAKGDGSNKRIVDCDPDVAADPGLLLRLARLVREVGRDRAGTDVRVLADVRVADVR